MRLLPALMLGAALLGGCDDGYNAARDADNVEGYEKYLTENPEGRSKLEAETRLEALLWEASRDARSLDSYDRYLKWFPEGKHAKEITDDREEALFMWARAENTEAGWKKFVEEYPKAERQRKAMAKRMLAAIAYGANLEVGEAVIGQVNLAEDPAGPMNGWGFTADVTNKGTDTLESLWITLVYLDEAGRPLEYKEWPLVTPDWPTPIEDHYKVPMKAGETRKWEWTTDKLPDNFAQKVKLYPSMVKVQGASDKAADAE